MIAVSQRMIRAGLPSIYNDQTDQFTVKVQCPEQIGYRGAFRQFL